MAKTHIQHYTTPIPEYMTSDIGFSCYAEEEEAGYLSILTPRSLLIEARRLLSSPKTCYTTRCRMVLDELTERGYETDFESIKQRLS